jgi:hypothetical protein
MLLHGSRLSCGGVMTVLLEMCCTKGTAKKNSNLTIKGRNGKLIKDVLLMIDTEAHV